MDPLAAVITIVLTAVLALAAIVIIRTLTFRSKQVTVKDRVSYPVNKDEAAARLGEALRFKTISSLEESQMGYAAFLGLHDFLQKAFPLVHSKLEKKVINKYGLLFIWKGSDAAKKPILLMNHQDVVPASDENWKYPPFAGAVEEGYIWGRGTLDDKGPLVSILEAFEYLLKEGYQPSRSIYAAFGFDEETGGFEGARKIAEYLREQGVRFEYILDEGLVATKGTTPGISDWTALIGIAEKGSVSLELSTEQTGGHSMSPPAQTTVGVIALAVTKLQAKLFPFRLTKAVSAQFEYLGPRMPFAMKMIFANMWLFGPLVIKRLSATMMASSLRTTTAPTMSSGGPQDNVLPQHASAIVNFRILQGDTVKSVIERSRRLIGDPRVKIATFGPCVTDPSPVSPVDNWAFGIISHTIREVMFDALVTPALVAGGTDTVFYRDLAECTYRFVPVRLPVEEISTIHGFDERISVDNYAEMICFYIRLLHNSCD